MSALTPLGIAILGLLLERPMHPYEMFQTFVARSEDRIVKVRPGSLYHTVERLDRDGLVRATGTEREGNRPERTTYEITDAGHDRMLERITEMLAEWKYEYPEFPLALAEAHNLPRDTVIRLLQKRVLMLRGQLELVGRAVDQVEDKNLDRKYWVEASYLRVLTQAETDWIESLIDELKNGTIDW
ncbi:PadR family transcriptional regulator [Humibacter sp.]|jgi:DNA-binding PadR family transcriptional regulator|uniref:PadR family transcriptional regulator n=1 Tax=Humibacter sp. TaxID=1940291 RepID=UPI002BBC978C|nr:PadR family transcriptional regulator [Humibacter sp.]HVX08484.1 PadR family transcriptional regulator [Humibacter sp.]